MPPAAASRDANMESEAASEEEGTPDEAASDPDSESVAGTVSPDAALGPDLRPLNPLKYLLKRKRSCEDVVEESKAAEGSCGSDGEAEAGFM